MPKLTFAPGPERPSTRDFKNWLIFIVLAGVAFFASQPGVGRFLKSRPSGPETETALKSPEPRPAFSVAGILREKISSGRRPSQTAPIERVHHGLCVAAMTGDMERTRELLENGVSADARDAFGIRAFERAVTWGHLDIVRLFLSFGADVNTRGQDGMSPVALAANQGDFEMTRLLLANGAARLPDCAQDAQAALSLARENGFADILRLLDDWLAGKLSSRDLEDLKVAPRGPVLPRRADADFPDGGQRPRGRTGDPDGNPPAFLSKTHPAGHGSSAEGNKPLPRNFSIPRPVSEAWNFLKLIFSGKIRDEVRSGHDKGVSRSPMRSEEPSGPSLSSMWQAFGTALADEVDIFRSRVSAFWGTVKAEFESRDSERKTLVIDMSSSSHTPAAKSAKPAPSWPLERFKSELESLETVQAVWDPNRAAESRPAEESREGLFPVPQAQEKPAGMSGGDIASPAPIPADPRVADAVSDDKKDSDPGIEQAVKSEELQPGPRPEPREPAIPKVSLLAFPSEKNNGSGESVAEPETVESVPSEPVLELPRRPMAFQEKRVSAPKPPVKIAETKETIPAPAVRLRESAVRITAPAGAQPAGRSEDFQIIRSRKPAAGSAGALPPRADPGFRVRKSIAGASGPDINRITPFGVTKLAYASKLGDIEWVRSLLDQGADVNVKGDLEMTALMLAAQDGHSEIVRMLLKHGASVNARNVAGQTALKLALLRENSRVAAALKEYGAVT